MSRVPRRGQRADRTPLPEHPYRDGALFHGVLAVILVAVAWLTGGGVARALVVGAIYFLLATGWTWWRFRQRILRERERRPPARRDERAAGEEGP